MRRLLVLLLLVLWAPTLALAEDEKAPAKPKVDPSVAAFFENVAEASRTKDRKIVAGYFDTQAMAKAIAEAGYLSVFPERQREAIRARLAPALGASLTRNEMIDPFVRYQIRSVAEGAGKDRLAVYAWTWDADGLLSKVRWHLVKRGASWAIYDLEDLEFGFGVLSNVGIGLLEASQGIPEAWRGLGAKFTRAKELLSSGDIDDAYEVLIELQALALPDQFMSLVQVLLGATCMWRGELDEALEQLDALAEIRSDVPVEYYCRAVIGNLQGEHEAALRAALRYVELLDADPDIEVERGIALYGLDRKTEALPVLTRVVNQEPTSAEGLAYFALCLPPQRRGELAGRFARLADPVIDHREIGETFIEHGAPDLLRLFAGFLEKARPGHYDVAFYEGQAFWQEEKYEQAALRFEVAQTRLFAAPADERPEDPDVVQTYVDAVLDAWLEAGESIRAYAGTVDPAHALDYIGDHLLYGADDAKPLRTFLAHVRANPPKKGAELAALRLRFYAGGADVIEAKYAEAIRSLQPLHAEVEKATEADRDDDDLESLLWDVEDRLVRALARAKRFDDALKLATHIDDRDEDLTYVALVHVLRGTVDEAVEAISIMLESGASPDEFLDDEDMAEPLKGPAYAALRKKMQDG
ncbi:MAG: hypothetical protein QNJ90_11060 [Planctomycetota bacterium]|nr:hypothetical protein [Planctomycetota bacterium]